MSKRSGCKILAAAVATGLGVLSAGSAQASLTTIGAPNYGRGGELSPMQILTATYGSSATFTRIDDSEDMTPSSTVYVKSAKAIATYATLKQSFAVGSADSYTTLFHVTGKDTLSPTGSTGSFEITPGEALIRYGGGTVDSSINSQNSDGKDHMVTYLVGGLKDAKKYSTVVVFFEDLPKGKSDFDFNDLAVEVKASATPVVPLPAAAWSGLMTMVGGAGVAGYRKMRRSIA